jgi:hypothetical protein
MDSVVVPNLETTCFGFSLQQETCNKKLHCRSFSCICFRIIILKQRGRGLHSALEILFSLLVYSWN